MAWPADHRWWSWPPDDGKFTAVDDPAAVAYGSGLSAEPPRVDGTDRVPVVLAAGPDLEIRPGGRVELADFADHAAPLSDWAAGKSANTPVMLASPARDG